MLAKDLAPGHPDDELSATVALIRSRVIKPLHELTNLLEQVGSAVELVQLSEDDRLFAPPEAKHQVIGAVTSEDLAQAARDVASWRSRNLKVVTVLDSDYPANLYNIFNRPPALFVEGSWIEHVDSRSIAVVGTRTATPSGLKRAERLSRELVSRGFTILSGMASGIDTAAHSSALAAGGRTIAVMGTGLDHRYPKDNAKLATGILASGGSLLTQFFPHQGPTRWTFPMRNVVMSGLSLATVVVEAAYTSGARMQARVALQHGRSVFLLKSLVASHEWARDYVTNGKYGTHAIEIETTQDIIDRLDNGHAIQSKLIA